MKQTIHLLVLSILPFCFYACEDKAPTVSIDNTKIHEKPVSVTKIKAPKASPHLKGILRPFTFTLTGTLGDEHPIEMYLSYNPDDLHQDEKNHCLDILGDYIYTNQQTSSFKLTGEFCFDMGIATLYHKKSKHLIKSFKGQFDGQVHSIKGKWTHHETEEHRVFELTNICNNIAPKTLQLFAQKLNEHLKNSKFCTIDEVGFDNKGIFLKNFDAKGLSIKDFSPTHLKWASYDDNEQNSLDYNETADLWFYNEEDAFVVVISAIEWSEKMGSDGQTKEKEKQTFEVWQFDGKQFKNIFVKNPDKINLSDMPWYAVYSNEKIQLYENKTNNLWEWP